MTKLFAPVPGLNDGSSAPSVGKKRLMFWPGFAGVDLHGVSAEQTAQEQLWA